MEGLNRVFLSGVLLGAACGFLAGHTLLWRPLAPQIEVRRSVREPFTRVTDSAAELYDFDEPAANTTVTNALAVAELPSLLMTPPDISSGSRLPKTAQLPDDFYAAPIANELPGESPGPLPEIPVAGTPVEPPVQLEILSARPLSEIVETKPTLEQVPQAAAAHDDELRRLIRERMGEMPAEEQEVWYESLHELSLPHAAGVLEMWQNSGRSRPVPDRLFPGIELGAPPALSRGDELFQPLPGKLMPPGGQPRPVEQHHRVGNLQAARQIHAENLRFAAVAGYRSRMPGMELTTAGEQLSPRINFRQGVLEETGRPLDCCIVGPGFFKVTAGEQEFYTRCGQFTLDAERWLVLETSGLQYQLQPPLQIPEESTCFRIRETGVVIITAGDGSVVEAGQLELWTFLNLAGLETENAVLFRNSVQSGVPVRVDLPEQSVIRSGVLELSNVDPAHEEQRLRQLEAAVR